MRSQRADLRRTLLVVALVGVVALVAFAFVGRWERHRWVDSQLDGMKRVIRLVGPLDQPSLVGFRVLPQFDCLVYRRGTDLLALELCVDREGRVLQAVDRRGGTRRYYDLHSDPGASTVVLDRKEVDRLLRKMGAEK